MKILSEVIFSLRKRETGSLDISGRVVLSSSCCHGANFKYRVATYWHEPGACSLRSCQCLAIWVQLDDNLVPKVKMNKEVNDVKNEDRVLGLGNDKS